MTNRARRLAVVLVVAAFGVAAASWEAGAQRRRAPRRAAAPARVEPARFAHTTPAHRRACDTCHAFPSANWKEARAGEEGFPDATEFPRHASCLECHRKQFFASERPAPKICSVCHVAVTPRETARNPFPNPVERFRRSARARDFVSAFRVSFPHAKHLEMLASARPGPSSPFLRATLRPQDANAVCATCHQTYQPQGESGDEYATPMPKDFDGFWLKKGTFKTMPEGHAKCFECHSLDSGLSPAPSDCAACHVLLEGAAGAQTDFDDAVAKRMGVDDPYTLKVWRRRDASATFPHDGGLHTEVGCTSCHDVAAMDAARGKAQIRIQSCGGDMGCHITATPDEGGALTFEVDRRKGDAGFACAKCHVAYAKRPIPPAHAEAVAKAGAD
jgi:hypothetical protein